MPHLTFTALVAVLLSTAMALLGNRSPRERLCVAAYIFFCCTAATVAGSWGMYLIHG
jgi:predicted MFS family arabinose efflux permease